MDCILKNTGKEYITAFQKNLLQVFPRAYRQVTEAEKQKLQKLIVTWKAFPKGIIFTMSVLSKLEKELQAIQNERESEKLNTGSVQNVQQQLERLIYRKKQLNPSVYPQVAGEIDVMNQVIESNVVAPCVEDQPTGQSYATTSCESD
jgi:predicted transcriptional regulator